MLQKLCFTAILTLLFTAFSSAQNVDRVLATNLASIQLFSQGNQQGLPVYALDGSQKIELHFDDLQGGYKNYFYSFVLCDYNWKEVNLNPLDYLKGFTNNRITNYRNSSIAFTRYTHYQAILPDQNCVPTKSGNYLLKVYLNGDTSQLAFTRQMLVLDQKTTITASVVQPFTPDYFNTHQRVKFTATVTGLNAFSAPQQVKAVVLQNNRWDIARRDLTPAFIRGNVLDYNTENTAVFPAGKEWRWLDLRSFRLQSDRIERAVYGKTTTDMYVVKDGDISGQRYVYFADYNGMYNLATLDRLNPFTNGDYATVNFSLVPPNGLQYEYKDVYLAGAFTDYKLNDTWRMKYNAETGLYESKAFLKQGYYNYQYITVDKQNPDNRGTLEGNYWETENRYTILLYYKSFTDRYDQLIGVAQIDSRTDRPGISF